MGLQRRFSRMASKTPLPAPSEWAPILEKVDELMMAEIVRRHPPKWRRAHEQGLTLQAAGEDFSPSAHFQMHRVVEKQLRDREPAFVVEAAARLEKSGVDAHEVRHLLAIPVCNQIFRAMQDKLPYDEALHRRELEELVEQHRRR